MFLDLQTHNYEIDIIPFLKNGIILDTSVFKIIIDGLISTKISKKKSPELEEILNFLDLMKINNKWDKFFITPHILTEVGTHLRNQYSKWVNYKEIVGEVMPLLKSMGESIPKKNKILERIDIKNPIVEIGDISIFITADEFTSKSVKVAILANDSKLCGQYKDSKGVMVMDYKSIILNRL